MFTVVAQKNLAGAEAYFDEHLSQNDYYTKEEVRAGQWIGYGAERIGLKVEANVNRENFRAFCENINPQTGERLTQRNKETGKRRVFYDFTCSAPKSVSILAVTLDDYRLVTAHEESTKLAFRELESFAATRLRKAGQQKDRITANLIAAAFLHTSSRALDPLLHTHFTVFNCTYDEKEKVWKALQAGPMFDAIRYGTEVYRNELARRVHALGYGTEREKHGWEIVGVNEAIRQRFSKRAAQRDAIVRATEQKLGRKLSNDEVAIAVHRSRAPKLKGISTAAVREQQMAQLQPEELNLLRALRESAYGQGVEAPAVKEEQMLEFATAHVFERNSVVAQHQLLETALAHGQGQMDLPKLKQALSECKDLVRTTGGLSTRQILETELLLIAAVEDGKSAVEPIHPLYRPSDRLSPDQQKAIRYLLQGCDRITGIRGLAGTGKTTALKELAVACEQAGFAFRFCAPTAAATDVLRKEGFNAVTLEAFLREEGRQLSNRTLIVVDESGAIGIDDMRRLFDSAPECRLILCGDTGQHGSVARGDALRILEEHSSYAFGQLTQIWRQRHTDYRRVVELAAKKDTAAAFAQLERMGDIKELSRDELYTTATQAYLGALKGNKSALLIAPTWNEIEAVTEKVREGLMAQGHLASEGHTFRVFDSLSWTDAQKRDARQYRVGQMLRFHQARGGFARDELVEVATQGKQVTVCRQNGSKIDLDPKMLAPCFDVGEARALKVVPGDKLLLQANWRKQFINGEIVQVESIQGEAIKLADGRVIPSDYRSFTHGYAVTSHAAQGRTVDEVFLLASSRSLPGVHRQQFYVSVSRGRERCRVFTDDRELLRSHVTDSSTRTAAVEAIGKKRDWCKLTTHLRQSAEETRRRLWQFSFRQQKTAKHQVDQSLRNRPKQTIRV